MRRVLRDRQVSGDKEVVLQDAWRADELSEGSGEVARRDKRNKSARQHIFETNMMIDGQRQYDLVIEINDTLATCSHR